MALHKLVIIQDGSLNAMARDGRYQSAFPFLRQLLSIQRARGGCGACGGSSNTARISAFQAAKQELAGQSPAKKAELKRLLNAEQVRIVYRNAAGKLISLTF